MTGSDSDSDSGCGSDWAAVRPRRSHTLAVLTGTAGQVHPSNLRSIPQVTRNIAGLAAALTVPGGCCAPEGVRIRVDPHTRSDVLDLILHRPDGTPPADGGELDVLLFSYAGHGVVPRDESHVGLALPGTMDRSPRSGSTSLPVAEVFAAMRKVPARHRVAVLDCCFSGTALHAAHAERIHLLTATEAKRRADYNTDRPDEPTVFTHALLTLLRTGIPDGPEHLDLTTLHRRLAITLAAAGKEEPLLRTVSPGGDLALFPNPAHGTARTREGLWRRAEFAVTTRNAAHRARAALNELTWRHRIGGAARLAQGIAEDGGRTLAEHDPHLLYYRQLLGSLLHEAGRTEEAARVLADLVATLTRVAGPDDPRTSQARAVHAALRPDRA
ncbi:caspase family protein [Streptomyces sp. 549]|uniref:caspase family protein n=1 Tax=Streptomyces sp. 549 TaxID=3049076 RepID=UPI0024C23E56|nr:caspase family protein [Streptomyces sp. 549]MDK1475459.1 caspase family protein [Streptomyces sp. 549]